MLLIYRERMTPTYAVSGWQPVMTDRVALIFVMDYYTEDSLVLVLVAHLKNYEAFVSDDGQVDRDTNKYEVVPRTLLL